MNLVSLMPCSRQQPFVVYLNHSRPHKSPPNPQCNADHSRYYILHDPSGTRSSKRPTKTQKNDDIPASWAIYPAHVHTRTSGRRRRNRKKRQPRSIPMQLSTVPRTGPVPSANKPQLGRLCDAVLFGESSAKKNKTGGSRSNRGEYSPENSVNGEWLVSYARKKDRKRLTIVNRRRDDVAREKRPVEPDQPVVQ